MVLFKIKRQDLRYVIVPYGKGIYQEKNRPKEEEEQNLYK